MTKEELLNLEIFIDNIYFQKYLELINKNISRSKEKHKTQRHHIIPRCYYKLNAKLCDNSTTNIVNLLYKDHVLAHYYLALCTKGNFKYYMICSLSHIIGNAGKFSDDPNLKNNLTYFLEKQEHYQELYEFSCEYKAEKYKGRKISAETINKRLETARKNGSLKHSEETKAKMRHKHNMSGKKKKPMSEETKAKLRLLATGRKNNRVGEVWVNNGKNQHYIKNEDLYEYLNNGYVKGKLKPNISEEGRKVLMELGRKLGKKAKTPEQIAKIKEKLQKKIAITNEQQNKHVDKEDLEYYLNNGWRIGAKRFTEQHKNNLRKPKRKKV